MENNGYVKWKVLVPVLLSILCAIFGAQWALLGAATKDLVTSRELQSAIAGHTSAAHPDAINHDELDAINSARDKVQVERYNHILFRLDQIEKKLDND